MCIRRPVTLHNCRITKHRTVETIFPLIPRTNTSETTSSSIAGEGSNMTRYDVVCTFTSPQIFIFTFLCPMYLTLPPLSFASNPTTLSLLSPSSTTPPLFVSANSPPDHWLLALTVWVLKRFQIPTLYHSADLFLFLFVPWKVS